MKHIEQTTDRDIRRSRWISGWVWFMSAMNLILIITLGYVLWRVIPATADLKFAQNERDQAIISRNQAIIERDQAFIQRDQAFDERYKEMVKRFDSSSRTLTALDSQLTLAQENQKKLGVLLQAQTNSFNATVNKLEEMANAFKR